MPKINIQMGSRNLVIVYKKGKEGFIEIQDKDSDMSLHIREEDDELMALHFIDSESDVVNQFDMDTSEFH